MLRRKIALVAGFSFGLCFGFNLPAFSPSSARADEKQDAAAAKADKEAREVRKKAPCTSCGCPGKPACKPVGKER